jgi:hypothetical protein
LTLFRRLAFLDGMEPKTPLETSDIDDHQHQLHPAINEKSLSNGEKDYKLRGVDTSNSWDSVEKVNVATDAALFDEEGREWNAPAETAQDLVTEVIHAVDDPSLNPWTFRMWFLGIGLSAFGGVLSTIYYFKPQTLGVSTIFLGCISYILGELMSHLIPRVGIIGRFLNPHPVCWSLILLHHI